MTAKTYFWFEFTLVVGGSFITIVGDQTYGIVLGISCFALGCVMLFGPRLVRAVAKRFK
jgi:hypothetical protein